MASNSKLTSLAIPAGVTEIPQNCFYNNTSLTSISFAGDITSIGSGAFYKAGLSKITIPGSCKSIGTNAFQLCPNLAQVTLGEGVDSLAEGAFRECAKLASINLPSSLRKIGAYAFLDNTSLTSVTIPAGVSEVGDAAFSNTGVTAFVVEAGNTACKAVDGVLYSADGRVLMAYPNQAAAEYTIADGCLGVGEGAFSHAQVQKVIVPEELRAFDDNAFSESALAEINFPSSVVLLGNQAFAKTQLTTLVLPENITAVYEGTFAQCEALKSVTIPAGVRTIGAYAFNGCSALTEVFCLGANPPLLDYYEGYDHPFGNIEASQVTVYVPKGTLSDYENSEWGSQFDHIVESATGVLAPESVLPANDSELESLGTLEITFATNIFPLEQYPKVTVVKGQELAGEPVVIEWGWLSYAIGQTLTVYPVDEYQEGVQPIALESGEEYYVTIPAGIVMNADGDRNQKIVLHFTGKEQSGIAQVESNECFVTQNAGLLQVVLGSLSNCTVELFNTTGHLLDRIDGAQGSVSFQPAASGLYIVRVTSGNTSKTFKVVK
ncbi:MAG TPA: leucine-rich repeat domain-containing protein [Barnesiella viscericola]|uniref:Leucine-rich repeat domain-containing protein n=2 Tax=Barnesiella viscericola TaxID=397865 RepID=A0A921MQX6_9BACT|nr:leucine-rich repeat domain-containing protein [Barnesiella viscericola]HJG88675.1 leucine-rich repeat domain-containing protein [Barnesiella viscericola]